MKKIAGGVSGLFVLFACAGIARADESGRVLVVGRHDDRLTPRVTTELRAMGLQVDIERVESGEPTRGNAIIVRIDDDRVEIWSVNEGAAPRFEERVPRPELEEDDIEISAQSAERVRARVIRMVPRPPVALPREAGKFVTSGSVALVLSGGLGGGPESACGTTCSSPVGSGARVGAVVAYRNPAGIAFGLAGGYSSINKVYAGRSASANPIGFETNQGTAHDDLSLTGPYVGPMVSIERGHRWKLSGAIGAGIQFASWSAVRDANLSTGALGASYSIHGVSEKGSLRAFYVAPEIRASYAISEPYRVFAGVTAIGTFGLDQAKWEGKVPFHAGTCPNPSSNMCQGLARLASEDVFGSLVVNAGPFIGASADF